MAGAKRLLEKVDISVPDDKIFGQGSGKKWATIQKLLTVHPGCNAFFLEDRLKALQEVQEHPDLVPQVVLALADWGYCMPEAVQEAQDSGMAILDLKGFRDLCAGKK